MVVRSIFLFLTIFCAFGCTSLKYPKTDKIPKDAKWVGGKDGGVWVHAEIIETDTVSIDAYGVYSDKTSELLGNFKYKITCNSTSIKINSNKVLKAILFTDGLNIEWNRKKAIYNCLEKIPKNQ